MYTCGELTHSPSGGDLGDRAGRARVRRSETRSGQKWPLACRTGNWRAL